MSSRHAAQTSRLPAHRLPTACRCGKRSAASYDCGITRHLRRTARAPLTSAAQKPLGVSCHQRPQRCSRDPRLGSARQFARTLALIAVACGSGDPQATTPAPAPAAGEDSATTTTLASNGDRAVNEPPAAPADPEPPSQPSGTSETTAPEDPPASASTTTSQPETRDGNNGSARLHYHQRS